MRYRVKGINHWSKGFALGEIERGLTGKVGSREQGVQNENLSWSQDLKIQWDCLLESWSYLNCFTIIIFND